MALYRPDQQGGGVSTLPKETAGADFLSASGEMAALMRAKGWAETPLGPPGTWPQSLRTTVRIMLTSRYAMWMGWGPELTFFYNDAYKPTLGVKHPWALGSPAQRVWAEIWPEIGPRVNSVLAGGVATWDEALLLFLERSGYPEETYHTFSYSPLHDDDGQIAGMLCVVTEETERVIGERRLASLRHLGAELSHATTQREVGETVRASLQTNLKDLPFTLIYLLDEEGSRAHRYSVTGLESSHPLAPAVLDAEDLACPWPLRQMIGGGSGTDHIFVPLGGGLEALVNGGWDLPPREALIMPMARQGHERPAGFVVTGLNPYRPRDSDYVAFIRLLSGQIEAAIANARAYEEERRRAEALAELDRAKTTFFSNISHEFRTPLTLMLSPLEDVLQQGETASDDRSLLQVAHRNGLRLLKLVNSLLDFARIESGRMDARFRPTDLAAYTADLASNFRSAMERAGLALTVECAPLPATVYVDHDMWEKIVLNLLSNAFKFTFDGGVTVRLQAAPDNSRVMLTVSDTGTGIPADELPRLFERFHRVEGARGRTFEGSGIGLALVQELVRMHGGEIAVTSDPGHGSAFRVEFPFGHSHLPSDKIDGAVRQSNAVRAQAFVEEALRWLPDEDDTGPFADEAMVSDAEDSAAPVVSSAVAAEGGGRHILLADDNADMRDYIRRLLVSQGFEVRAVGDGAAALAAAKAAPPDLIVSDVMMPKLDGFGLLAALRADRALSDIPVVLLSARAGQEAEVEGLEAGAEDYLTKPFTARELISRVRTTLRLADTRRAAERAMREDARVLEILNKVGAIVSAELDLDRAVQAVTDLATDISDAAFGAFFYNVTNERGESYMLYTLSGVDPAAFSAFPMPRNTAVFAPTFRGEGVVRSDDITKDPRYGQSAPHHGMPEGHLPVRSYLAVPVVARSGEIVGGLFFGHPEPGRFDERAERIVTGIAAQAAIAIDNARLYKTAQILNERLESKVEERTVELIAANEKLRQEAAERERAEEALRQAQKMETIGQLTGGVAHDFNNLLTVIMGSLDALQRQLAQGTPDGARLRRSLENAQRGSQRAAALTQRLLAFSRRQPLQPKLVDVNRLVANMSDLLRRTLGEQIGIETVLAGGLWRVHADPNQLESAILNLAINARDAMPGGGRLTIETANTHLDEHYATLQAEVAPGQYVLIAVSDTGTGMDRATLGKAFEPFFTTKDVGQGTGLGLSQVYGFVKQSGGHVKLYSEVSEGTTVKIYLPRLVGADSVEEVVESLPAVPRGDRHEIVLVVEDDEDVRTHSVETLSELGYRVIDAPNGAAALAILQSDRKIDLLFTDVGLPGGMNGRQLADAARLIRPDLKVLFTTGYARNAIVHDGRLDPGVHLITKPYTYGALAHRLVEILDESEASPCVLLVDDEIIVRTILKEGLEDLGYRTEEAGSATEAMSKYRLTARQLRAVILDVGLPDRGGDSVAAELRALDRVLPIIIASGYGEAALRERFGSDARTALLTKPYVVEQLDALLRGFGVRPPDPLPSSAVPEGGA